MRKASLPHAASAVLALALLAALPFLGACAPTPDSDAEAALVTDAEYLEIVRTELDQASGVVTGNKDARVTVYEFADFQCPGCRAAATAFLPVLRERYIDTGKIRYSFIQFPLPFHKNARAAAHAALCANAEGRFSEYHDTLYAKQNEWKDLDQPAARFADYAKRVGLERKAFEMCLADTSRYNDVIAAGLRHGRSIGIKATPTFFVNGREISRPNGQAIVDAIEEALADTTRTEPGKR